MRRRFSPLSQWLRRVVTAMTGAWTVSTGSLAARHVEPSMVARYSDLADVLDAGRDREVRFDSQRQVTILLMMDRREDGPARRSVLRLDQAELDGAGWNGTTTAVVFDEFILEHDRPVVRHRVGAVRITREADGRARVAGIPAPRHDGDTADVTRMLERTGADLALTSDLDNLLTQLRAGVALVP
ncbi:hypothetical protein ACIRG5_19020 [Lentzea sp. NPDC102401]|uniref:hypothetical protein n=1 Tax=Lentzea sp. NPDC102401 TaxID=3364128 RepID=UPI0037F73405